MLGPILFLIYVNSIANSLQCQWKAFGDGFKLYFSFPRSTCAPILKRMMLLQNGLDRICSIARTLNLRLNIGKCVAMRFGVCNTGNNLHCSYSIDGKALNFVTYHRDLGVLVDSKLRFHDYIRNVVRNCRQEFRYSWPSSATRTFTPTEMKMKTIGE